MFLCVEKIVFGIEKSNMCLLNKTKSFGFKKYQIYFGELEKKNLDCIKKNHIRFITKNLDLYIGKSYLFLYD